jgi:hypothetical protein
MSMLSKIVLVLSLFLCFNSWAFEERVEVIVKKTEITDKTNLDEVFAANGIRQAITAEAVKRDIDTETFWKKIEDKKLSDKEEIDFFKPVFSVFNIAAITPTAPAPTTPDQFQRATLTYEIDLNKAKDFFDEVMSDMSDVSLKTFYILPEVKIASEMVWTDVGVSKEEYFSGVIIDSWKKWAATQFKNYPNVVILKKDFITRPERMNPESVTLKWTSMLKKGEVFQDRKSAQFEVSAQYVLVNTKTNQSLVAFDFPNQKREMNISVPKDLSSGLASLIYNMLNSQTSKIASSLELNKANSALSIVDIKVTGKNGLYDITQVNNFLVERFKAQGLTSELKSYSSEDSVISIKSSLTSEALYAELAKDGGKLPLSEQKLLLFTPETKSFAIIPK